MCIVCVCIIRYILFLLYIYFAIIHSYYIVRYYYYLFILSEYNLSHTLIFIFCYFMNLLVFIIALFIETDHVDSTFPFCFLQQKYITEFQREKEEFEKNMARFK